MTDTRAENERLWSGDGGRKWVVADSLVDGLFQPIKEAMSNAVASERALHVLDVGCGTGSTTIAAALARYGPRKCTGIDISSPMISAAQARAREEGVPVDFILADAEAHTFGAGSFDMIISRFGVMFFADPIRAFSNLHDASAEGALMHLMAWRSPLENPFMTAVEVAVAHLLPNLPPRNPDAPGQFAFADADRVRDILVSSEWKHIDISPTDFVCTMPTSGLNTYLTNLGPVGRAIDQADEPARQKIVELGRSALEPYVAGSEVRLTAACWTIRARR